MVVGGMTLIGHAVERARLLRPLPSGEGAWSAGWAFPAAIARYAALPTAITLWLVSLRGIDPRRMDDLGLVPLLPVTFWLALVILLVGLCIQLYHLRSPTPLLVAHVLGLVAVLHATPSILYGTLRYSWAWKHVGVTDFFMRHAGVNRALHELSAYQYWPGFFTANAMLTK